MKNKDNITDTTIADEGKPIPAPVAAPEKNSGFKSFGLKAHNEITYRGVDLFMNTAFAVGFAYWSKRTKQGVENFGQPVKNFFSKITSAFTKDPHTIESGSHWGSLFTSIMVGGTAIIPVMMGLEQHSVKKAIVKGVNEIAYGKERVENDPRFAEELAQIEHEPKKDFWTGMKARFAVLIPMIAWSMTRPLNEPTEKYVYDNVAKGTKYVAKQVGIQPKGGMTHMQEGVSNWDFLHKTIAFDITLTAIYSYAHEFFYKRFAQAKADNQKTECSANAALHHAAPLQQQAEIMQNEPAHGKNHHPREELRKPRSLHKHDSHLASTTASRQHATHQLA